MKRVGEKEKYTNPRKKSEFIGNQLGLKEGKIYALKFREQVDGNKRFITVRRKMRFVKAFKHHALFENEYGIKRSFTWWETEKILKGDSDEY